MLPNLQSNLRVTTILFGMWIINSNDLFAILNKKFKMKKLLKKSEMSQATQGYWIPQITSLSEGKIRNKKDK